MKIALYPGTFDPVTLGHLDVIARAREIFDRVIVTVALNTTKEPLFSDAERVNMIYAKLSDRTAMFRWKVLTDCLYHLQKKRKQRPLFAVCAPFRILNMNFRWR